MSKRRKHSTPSMTEKSVSLVDIVIPVYGRFDLLFNCLNALPGAAGNLSYNLILVDNNSPDVNAADLFYREVQDKHPGVVIIRNRENKGFPYACNQGARRKSSPFIFFLNSDVILKESAIVHLVRAFDNPQVGVVGMKLLFPEDSLDLRAEIRPPGKVQHVGLCTNIRGNFYHVFSGWSSDHPRVMNVREVYAVTGAALMTKRNLWNKIGGFDLIYGHGTYEDVDYCLSVRKLGYNVIVEQLAIGFHYTGATAEHYRIPYPLERNWLVFMNKWMNELNYTEINHL